MSLYKRYLSGVHFLTSGDAGEEQEAQAESGGRATGDGDNPQVYNTAWCYMLAWLIVYT